MSIFNECTLSLYDIASVVQLNGHKLMLNI